MIERLYRRIETIQPCKLCNISGTYDPDYKVDKAPYQNDFDSVNVGVSDPGTEIDTVEHGSGYYQQEQLVHLNSSNKSIRLEKKIFAKHAPTSLSFQESKIRFQSLCSTNQRQNYVRNETVSEKPLHGPHQQRELFPCRSEPNGVQIDRRLLRRNGPDSVHQDKNLAPSRDSQITMWISLRLSRQLQDRTIPGFLW